MFSFSDINKDRSISKREFVKEFANSDKLIIQIKRSLKKYSGTYNLLSNIKNRVAIDDIYEKHESNKLNVPKIEYKTCNPEQKCLFVIDYKKVSLFANKINEFNRLVQKDDNKLLILFHPEINTMKLNINFNKYFKNIDFINLTEIFQNNDVNNLYFVNKIENIYDIRYKNDSHLTRFSNNLISNSIYENLVLNNFFE